MRGVVVLKSLALTSSYATIDVTPMNWHGCTEFDFEQQILHDLDLWLSAEQSITEREVRNTCEEVTFTVLSQPITLTYSSWN